MLRVLTLSLFMLVFLAWGAWAQDSVAPNADAFQLNSTLGTGPGKILTYAKFIGLGQPGDASMESVQSSIDRLWAAHSTGGSLAIRIEYSADNLSWHNTYDYQADQYFRFTIGGGSPSDGIQLPRGETGQSIVTKLSALTAGDRLSFNAL